MNDQAKIQRTLRLLMLLSSRKWHSAADIRERIDISGRTLYRYLNTLDEAGFWVERGEMGYRLAATARKHASGLLHFSDEEASLLFDMLQQLQGGGRTRDRLLQKLHTLYDCHILARPAKQHVLQIAGHLREAMDTRVQAILRGYRSNHSNSIKDRRVEPFELDASGEAVWCYEPESGANKQFKLSRIQSVVLTPQPWQHEPEHQSMFVDAFGFAAPQPLATVRVWLSLKAANLLQEEYPDTRTHISEAEYGYYFTGPVANWKGIGRFVKGMEGDVVVAEPEEFKNYLGW
jgi:proteasome accessory factor C